MKDLLKLEMELNQRVNKLDRNMAQVKERVDGLRDDISEIKNNHLFHLQADITALKVDLAKQGTKLAIILSIAIVIIEIALEFLFKR